MPLKPKAVHIGITVAICLLAARPVLLYNHTRELASVSNKFPREYTIGFDKAGRVINYIALGDSTVQGAGCQTLQQTLTYKIASEIAAEGFRVKVTNLAVIGATTADVVRDQLPKLDSLHPDIITLEIGANDATHFTDFIDFGHNISMILAALTKNPSTIVAVANTPDLACVPAMQPVLNEITAWRARRQNAILRDLVDGSSVQLVDFYADGKLIGRSNYANDQFHPSPQGYAKWAALFKPAVQLSKS